MSWFPSILIANRGEIAVRVIRACRTLGIEAIAVYSDADERALHVREADRALPIGPAPATQSYLNIEALIAAAKHAGAAAIHPGYGFLSENAAFAQACADAGIVFIGPPVAAIELMGSKSASKALAVEVGVPTVPGYNGDDQSVDRLRSAAEEVGFPLLIKASAGGGGKGMRAVTSSADFVAALEAAQREARSAFGDDRVLLERLIQQPRHVEIQVLGDQHGNVVHLGERECSIQRRHQKIVEESPSPVLDPATRAEMGAAAVRLAQAVGYTNAGTVEFVLDPHGKFYFLEMNTRLQVEHPVTEEVTGIDLVQAQIAVAAGQPLPWSQDEITQHGHAIEVRLYAEDPVQMLPAVGTLARYAPPVGPGVRLDTGVTVGDSVGLHYDPMLAKLIVSAPDRAAAVARLQYALDTFEIAGVTTNLPLLRAIIAHPAFAAGATTTDFLQTNAIMEQVKTAPFVPAAALCARALLDLTRPLDEPLPADPFLVAWRPGRMPRWLRYRAADELHTLKAAPQEAGRWTLTCGDESSEWVVLRRVENRLWARVGEQIHHAALVAGGVVWDDVLYAIEPVAADSVDTLNLGGGASGDADLQSPMPGTVIKLLVEPGQTVSEGQPLLIIEAMKMEHTIAAPYAGTVVKLPYAVGAQVAGGAALVELERA